MYELHVDGRYGGLTVSKAVRFVKVALPQIQHGICLEFTGSPATCCLQVAIRNSGRTAVDTAKHGADFYTCG